MYNINVTVLNYFWDVFEIIFIGVPIYLLARIFSLKLDFLGLLLRFIGFIRNLFKAKR